MTMTGGSIQPYQPKGDEVLAHRSDGDTWPAVWRPREDWAHPTYDEGGVLPAGTLVANGTGKPEPVFTAEQVERGAAWIRDHYRDGTFHCPSSGISDPPPATPVISTFERDGKHGWTCELCGWLGLELGSEQAALKEAGRHLVDGEHPKV